jgi:hypothetical protein
MLFEPRQGEIAGSDGLRQETEDRKSKVKSDFGRQKFVEIGLVRNVCSSVSLSVSARRVWVGSSVKSCSGVFGRMFVVAFEKGSSLEEIWESAFHLSWLRSIVIPSSVVVLGKSSFYESWFLESVTFESGSRLERIEESAFEGSGLRSIEIPSSVVVLGKNSFFMCEKLESMRFENGSRLERIEETALSGEEWLSIEIPGSVTFVDGSAFIGVSLISVSPENRRFRFRECFLEDFDGSKICRYFGSCRSVVIPSSVVVLGKSSFSWCWNLESVIFESGSRLERIEERAFLRCTLRSIVIPSSVVVLGKESFEVRGSLEPVIFESGSRLERIKARAFYESASRSIVIPSSVIVLGKLSFYKCRSLESVTFESGSRLERIKQYAFAESGLKSIEIPSSVVFLGLFSFHKCESLELVTFESDCRLERIDQSMFADSRVSFCSVCEEFRRSRRSGKPEEQSGSICRVQ